MLFGISVLDTTLALMTKPETILKLRDAANQMKFAIENLRDEEKFRSCINSYLSAGRSVTMVLERECKPLGMTDWYKSQTKLLGESPLFRLFNAQRVYSIHKGVVQPVRKGHKVKSAKFWYKKDNEGNQKLHSNAVIEADEPVLNIRDIASFSEDGTMWAWFFDGIEGYMPGDSGNVLRLCEDYYLCLKWLVEEWIREKYRRGIKES